MEGKVNLKSHRRFITCTCCGKKIYEGQNVYKVAGIIYTCCSASCLAYSMLNYNVYTLDDEFLKEQGEEWEG